MNNIKHIRNLMVIHRELGHLITAETKTKFDETITAAIIALDRCDNLSDEEVDDNNLSELHQGSAQTES